MVWLQEPGERPRVGSYSGFGACNLCWWKLAIYRSTAVGPRVTRVVKQVVVPVVVPVGAAIAVCLGAGLVESVGAVVVARLEGSVVGVGVGGELFVFVFFRFFV